jgi:hypothetical protein
VKQGDFLIKEYTYYIPGDIVEIKHNTPEFLYFYFTNQHEDIYDFILINNFNIDHLKLNLINFAIKHNNIYNDFTVELVSGFTNYAAEEIISREQWQARNAKEGLEQEIIKRRFTIHHSEGSAHANLQRIRNIQNYHMNDKNWLDIGYHFLISCEGLCFAGRDLHYKGAHVFGHNEGNIGICCIGCFETSRAHYTEITPAMTNKLAQLIARLSIYYNIDISSLSIKGHREYNKSHTLCPGNIIINYLDDLIIKISDIRQELCMQN